MKITDQARALLGRLRATPTPSPRPLPEREPVVRRMNFDFDAAEIPRYWLGGSVLGTAVANSLNLIFPDGERFFVRSVNHFIDEIDDPQLRARIKRFYGQEGQHAREHERLFEIMRGHGYDIDAFLVPYRRVAYELLAPRFSAKMHLSITAALEHFTASFAEHSLTQRTAERLAPPVMAELLQWHAAEEIEHKDVAFEVLQRVDDSYALRVAGLTLASVVLTGFWLAGIAVLLSQEPELDLRALARDFRGGPGKRDHLSATMPAAFLAYLDPDFHPAKVPNDELALAYLESIGRRHG